MHRSQTAWANLVAMEGGADNDDNLDQVKQEKDDNDDVLELYDQNDGFMDCDNDDTDTFEQDSEPLQTTSSSSSTTSSSSQPQPPPSSPSPPPPPHVEEDDGVNANISNLSSLLNYSPIDNDWKNLKKIVIVDIQFGIYNIRRRPTKLFPMEYFIANIMLHNNQKSAKVQTYSGMVNVPVRFTELSHENIYIQRVIAKNVGLPWKKYISGKTEAHLKRLINSVIYNKSSLSPQFTNDLQQLEGYGDNGTCPSTMVIVRGPQKYEYLTTMCNVNANDIYVYQLPFRSIRHCPLHVYSPNYNKPHQSYQYYYSEQQQQQQFRIKKRCAKGNGQFILNNILRTCSISC